MSERSNAMQRVERIREALEEAKLDALMISAPGEENLGMESRYYTSGFTGSAGVVLVTRDRSLIAADFRYTEQAEAECLPRGFGIRAESLERFSRIEPLKV